MVWPPAGASLASKNKKLKKNANIEIINIYAFFKIVDVISSAIFRASVVSVARAVSA